MQTTQQYSDYDSFYEKFSNDLIEEFYENVFGNVTQKTQKIRDQQKSIIERVNVCNEKILEKDTFQENYKKCLFYFEKAVNVKRDLIIINEKCINLKKRALKLREDCELSKTKLILEKQKITEEEQKLIPKMNPKLLPNTQVEPSSPSSSDEHILVTSGKISKKNRRKPNTVNPGNEINENEQKIKSS